jgi:transcriptional regulator with XRE-family HTH domain
MFHTLPMPNPQDEKQAFAKRLKQALKRSPKKVETATDLSIQFNLRHPNEPVTVQATQKWLSGQARPTVDKIETLAEWLNVSAQWLRYGIAEERPVVPAGRKAQKGKALAVIQPTEDELKLLARIRSLPEHQRYLVNEIVEQFSLEQEIWRE